MAHHIDDAMPRRPRRRPRQRTHRRHVFEPIVRLFPRHGTKEAKRWDRAVPASEDDRHYGCLASAVVYATLAGWLFISGGRWFWLVICLLISIPVAVALAIELYGFALLFAVHRTWRPRGIRFLVIHSASSLWSDHIRFRWLPRMVSS